jgi:uncharacterized protein YjhX (UPF0386 family)
MNGRAAFPSYSQGWQLRAIKLDMVKKCKRKTRLGAKHARPEKINSSTSSKNYRPEAHLPILLPGLASK